VLKEYADRVKTDSVALFVPIPSGPAKMLLSARFGEHPHFPMGRISIPRIPRKGKELLKFQPMTPREGVNGLVNNRERTAQAAAQPRRVI